MVHLFQKKKETDAILKRRITEMGRKSIIILVLTLVLIVTLVAGCGCNNRIPAGSESVGPVNVGSTDGAPTDGTPPVVTTGDKGLVYEADFLEMYSGFLDYSLGNWTLEDSGVRDVWYPQLEYKYNYWKVGYEDSLGVKRILEFDNTADSGDEDRHFAQAVLYSAADITAGWIKDEIQPAYIKGKSNEYLSFEVKGYSIFSLKDQTNPQFVPDDSYFQYFRSVISAEDGLRLYDYDKPRIFEDRRFYLYVRGGLEDKALYTRAAGSLYSGIRAFTGISPDALLELVMNKPGTFSAIESTDLAYIGGKAVEPEPQRGQGVQSWFEPLLQKTYFSK